MTSEPTLETRKHAHRFIMTALRKDSFAIKEADMIDANLRTRGRGRDSSVQ